MIAPATGGRHLVVLDLDWAPDEAIDFTSDVLVAAGVPAIWFVTHRSPAVDRLAMHEGFELGIHPNFLEGSDHGSTTESVFTHCLEIVPGARFMRTHWLVQSTGLMTVAARVGIEADLSILLPRAESLAPVIQPTVAGPLVRLPTCFEDDIAMIDPATSWTPGELLDPPGIRALAFHPIHIWRNHRTLEEYAETKRRLAVGEAMIPRPGRPGAGSLFAKVVQALSARGSSVTVRELVDGLR